MKKISLIFLLAFVIGLSSTFQAKSQAVKTVLDNVTIEIKKAGSTDDPILLTGGYQLTIESGNGNLLRTISFKLEDDHELMDFPWPNRLISLSIRDENGDLIVRDELAILTRSGNLKFTFHINGAGNRLPVGWIKK